MDVKERQLNALRSFMVEEKQNLIGLVFLVGGIGVLLLVGGIGVLCLGDGIRQTTEDGALGILVALVCIGFAYYIYNAFCGRDADDRYAVYIEHIINTAATFGGMDTLLDDFAASCTIASPMTDSIRMGKQFLYLGSKGEIFHVSEIQEAKVNVESRGEDTDYDLRLFGKRDGKEFFIDHGINPWHERRYAIVADVITQWAADWHRSHPYYKKEAAE